MQFTFIANACTEIASENYRIVTDPWLTDGIYDGAWYHFPPLTTRPEDLIRADAVYISHIHPDHFDAYFMKLWPREKPIVILDQEPNYLLKMLTAQGYTNILRMRCGESATIGPFHLTMYNAFCGNVFHDWHIDNVIDSALLIDDGKYRILNTNDNLPDVHSAKLLREKHGVIDLLLLICNAAGPYPACFDNLSEDEKHAESRSIIERNFAHAKAVTEAFAPRAMMPFAGDFVLGGRLWRKNFYNATTTCDEAADYLRRNLPIDTKIVAMNEGQKLDLSDLSLDSPYLPVDSAALARYARQVLSCKALSYDMDPIPPNEELCAKLAEARANLWKNQQRLKCYLGWTIGIQLGQGEWFCFRMDSALTQLVEPEPQEQNVLLCRIDLRLLWRILMRRANWNNAEISCHIDFIRRPNEYEPDLHQLMSFFHTA